MRLNPTIWGEVEAVELSPLEAKLKATSMAPLVANDLHEAVKLFGVFEAWERQTHAQNNLMCGLQGAVKVNILLCLARIFEFGTARGYSQDSRDIASLPFLIRLMSEADVQTMIAAAAANWNEPSFADENMDIVWQAFDQSYEALQDFEKSLFASNCLHSLRQTRNGFIAHRLLEKNQTFQMLSIEDVRFLLHAAIDIFSPLELAMTGEESGYFELARQAHAEAKTLGEHKTGARCQE